MFFSPYEPRFWTMCSHRMAEVGAAKGTVTSLGSVFSSEEAHKAAERVDEAISERRRELQRLKSFASDNAALINLVRSLPNETSHDIMVPFGGAAFFPGRLIHSNEFLVLLGENYFAERTAKQTVEILQRRGKTLEMQTDSLKVAVMDLEVEAKFFTSTAAEAAEGLVEIREEYSEDPQMNDSESGVSSSDHLGSSNTHDSYKPDKDDEYARMMVRLDELENEELGAGTASGSDNNEDNVTDDDNEDDENETDVQAGFSFSTLDQKLDTLEIRDPKLRSPAASVPVSSGNEQFVSAQKLSSLQSLPISSVSKFEGPSHDASNQNIASGSIASQAFTGSIVEHDHGLLPIQSTKTAATRQVLGSNPSKPVSRFKLQKGRQ